MQNYRVTCYKFEVFKKYWKRFKCSKSSMLILVELLHQHDSIGITSVRETRFCFRFCSNRWSWHDEDNIFMAYRPLIRDQRLRLGRIDTRNAKKILEIEWTTFLVTYQPVSGVITRFWGINDLMTLVRIFCGTDFLKNLNWSNFRVRVNYSIGGYFGQKNMFLLSNSAKTIVCLKLIVKK